MGLAPYDCRSHLGRLHIRVAGCYSCRLTRRQRRTPALHLTPRPCSRAVAEVSESRPGCVRSLVESGCGATIVSVRHTAARATRLVVSIHALSTVPCLASSSICLLLEYCIIALLPHCPIALSRADQVAGSTPQPTCHGVNIAQIAVDNQTPCTTSSMRRVTSTS